MTYSTPLTDLDINPDLIQQIINATGAAGGQNGNTFVQTFWFEDPNEV